MPLRILFSLILFLFLGSFLLVSAHEDHETTPNFVYDPADNLLDENNNKVMPSSLKTALDNIMVKQNVTEISELNEDEIGEDDLEMLGDVLLTLSHTGEEHALIHQENGGEGSEELRQYHINTAKKYLGLKTIDYTGNTEQDSYESASDIESNAGTLSYTYTNIIVLITILVVLLLGGLYLFKRRY